MKKTVLITGCSSGFGVLAAKTFSDNGWNVVATMRSPEKASDLTSMPNVLVTKLDVTDRESVAFAVEKGITQFGRIDVLVNNAGYGGHAIFEQATDRIDPRYVRNERVRNNEHHEGRVTYDAGTGQWRHY